MGIAQVQPIDLLFIEMIREYLERVESPSGTQPEASHMRLLAPRKELISDAKTAIARATAARWHVDEASLTSWQLDSVILWARELAEAEVLRVGVPHVDSDYARAVRVSGHVARPVPHRVPVVPGNLNAHRTDPSRIREG